MKFSVRVKLSEQDLTISEKTTLVTSIPCLNLLSKKPFSNSCKINMKFYWGLSGGSRDQSTPQSINCWPKYMYAVIPIAKLIIFIVFSISHFICPRYPTSPGGGVLPYIGYIGMCGPKGYGFSAILVINWVSILAILPPFLVINRVSIFAL